MSNYCRNSLHALIVAQNRSGGTFLAEALDSHPRIGCERGEPLSPDSSWYSALNCADTRNILNALYSRVGYDATACKVVYRQYNELLTQDMLDELDLHLIHLHRPNLLRQVISSIIVGRSNSGAPELAHVRAHTYKPLLPFRTRLNCEYVERECYKARDFVPDMIERLEKTGRPLLLLTYDDLVGREGDVAYQVPESTSRKICDFLGVNSQPLVSSLTRASTLKLSELVENWSELVERLQNTPFAWCLEGEL